MAFEENEIAGRVVKLGLACPKIVDEAFPVRVDPQQTVHMSQLLLEVVILLAQPRIVEKALICSLIHEDAGVNRLIGLDFIGADHSRPENRSFAVESDMSLANGDAGADHHPVPNALDLSMKQIEQFVEEGAIIVLGIEDTDPHDRVRYRVCKGAAEQAGLLHSADREFFDRRGELSQLQQHITNVIGMPRFKEVAEAQHVDEAHNGS